MKVILKQDVKGTGKKGEILDVSDGFAKNFLLKKGLAEQASSVAVNSLKLQKEAEERRRAEEIRQIRELAQKRKSIRKCHFQRNRFTPRRTRLRNRQKENCLKRPHQNGRRLYRGNSPYGRCFRESLCNRCP